MYVMNVIINIIDIDNKCRCFVRSVVQNTFKLNQLYSYLKEVGVVNRIKYVNNEKEDSAIVFIQDWKSSYFKDYFNQQLKK